MNIRSATYKDAPAIKLLLEALGYKTRLSLLVDQLDRLFGNEDHQVYVCERVGEVMGFVSVHYLPQLAFDGGVAIISYLSLDETKINHDAATALEQYVTVQARKRKCERIQLHCAEWRAVAHQFYLKQNYQEYPKYFTKRLIYGE